MGSDNGHFSGRDELGEPLANELYEAVPGGPHHLHIIYEGEQWPEIWFNPGPDEFEGLCVASGSTVIEALDEAITVFALTLEALKAIRAAKARKRTNC